MRYTRTPLITLAAAILLSTPAAAQSNIDPAHRFAWGENIGWTNWRGTAPDGVRVMTDHLQGFIWAENVGWINVGNGGGPYANTMGANFGVNIDSGTGLCSGLAWGENIGWINFDTAPFIGAQGARFDSAADRFRGYAWGENVGWINLDDATRFVAVNFCLQDLDGDGSIGAGDLALLLGSWGPCPACPADLTGDGAVGAADLAQLLGAWGPCP